MRDLPNVLAIDVGNSRVKCGLFHPLRTPLGERDWPVCQGFTTVGHGEEFPWPLVAQWCEGHQPLVVIAGSHPQHRDRLASTWLGKFHEPPLVIRDRQTLPIAVRVDSPEKVGLDRLLNAVAADRLKQPDHSAIVIDSGTATTIDLIDATGAFLGGTILPGMELGSRALHDYTALLPRVPNSQLGSPQPAAVGKNTVDAIRSGLYWGQLGAIRELVHQLTVANSAQQVDLFLTGGAASLLSPQLPTIRWEPHLTSQGLALSAWQRLATTPDFKPAAVTS